jgi:hypothetical protein
VNARYNPKKLIPSDLTPKSQVYALAKGFRHVYVNKPSSTLAIGVGRSKSSMNHARNFAGMHTALPGSRKYQGLRMKDNGGGGGGTSQSNDVSLDESTGK